MNCRTGEITDSPIVQRQWAEQGDRILRLPNRLDSLTVAEFEAESRRHSELLSTLGVVVVDSKQDAEARVLTAARKFVQKVNARR